MNALALALGALAIILSLSTGLFTARKVAALAARLNRVQVAAARMIEDQKRTSNATLAARIDDLEVLLAQQAARHKSLAGSIYQARSKARSNGVLDDDDDDELQQLLALQGSPTPPQQ